MIDQNNNFGLLAFTKAITELESSEFSWIGSPKAGAANVDLNLTFKLSQDMSRSNIIRVTFDSELDISSVSKVQSLAPGSNNNVYLKTDTSSEGTSDLNFKVNG